MARNTQVAAHGDSTVSARIVDGVSSINTYVVLATREGKRIALRFLNFTVDHLSGDKAVINLHCKVHLEIDASQRTPISQRTPGFFGQNASHYFMHSNRATGTFKIPVAYLPINESKLKERLTRKALVDVLWATLIKPTVDLGGQPALTHDQLAEWLAGELGKYSHPTAEGTVVRQTPLLEIKWDYGHDSSESIEDEEEE